MYHQELKTVVGKRGGTGCVYTDDREMPEQMGSDISYCQGVGRAMN